MFSAVRRRLTYANVAMTLALVLAMSGGAYAAKHYLISSTKQISPKVLKALQGKAGAQGLAGPQGPAGPAGSVGPKGETGAVGTNGKDGVSVSGKVLKAGEDGCAAGGMAYTSTSGTSSVCNGENGQTGWAEKLPSGKTVTGQWSIAGAKAAGISGVTTDAVTFPFRVENEGSGPAVHYIKPKAADPAGCTGNVENPGASAGNLCIFANNETENFNLSVCDYARTSPCPVTKANPNGFVMIGFAGEGEALYFASGTWAVTAE